MAAMATMRFYGAAIRATTVPGIYTHPEYDDAIEEWELIRDVMGGSRYVKARGERYLPRLLDQEEEDYRKYILRALFFNATSRTAAAMVGMLLRKTPELTISPEVEKITPDVDLRGSTLNDYIREVAENVSSLGRCGTLVDWSEEDGGRPYFSFYKAEDIIDWEEKRDRGKMRLTRLTLREIVWERSSIAGTGTGEVKNHQCVQIFRTYEIESGLLVVKERRVIDDDASANGKETLVEMKRRGTALKFIPFVFHTPMGNRSEVCPSPLADIAEINVSHFRSSADLENGRHFAGLPTLYAAGFDPNEKLVVGSSYAWVSENAEAKAGYIEFTGQGLTPLADALKEKQEQMAALGARMLEVRSADAESFETVQLRSNAEQASLTTISEALSATLSLALQTADWWIGTAEKPTDYMEADVLVLSTDFVGMKLSPQALAAMVAALQAGVISNETFFYNLSQGEVYKEGWSIDDEKRAIEQTPPTMRPPAPAPGKPGPTPPKNEG